MTNLWIYAYGLLTVVVFVISLKISQKLKSTILNPFIIGLTFLVLILLGAKIPYQAYYEGNALLNNLLGVAVVALALPFYEQFAQIRRQWKHLALIMGFATLLSMISGGLLALLFGANEEIIASILPKSVTAPIAIAIAGEIGGQGAIAVVGVMVAGITGSAFGIALLKIFKVKHPQAIGLSMGVASHALGVARTMEIDRQTGSYASIALVLCGVLSSLVAPFVFKAVLLLQ
ncbi:CidB/LrgB family autolysis modulator [Pasteurellaceae bacterium RH1A]|nr:CidB/LrgB family autolysis modulator [Pasteurellaceae bacterium RH1A]